MRYVSLERNSTAEARLRPRPGLGLGICCRIPVLHIPGSGRFLVTFLRGRVSRGLCEFPTRHASVVTAYSVVTASSDHGRLNLDPVHHDPVPIIAVCLIYMIYY